MGFFFRRFVRTVCMLRLKDSTVADDIYVGFARFSFRILFVYFCRFVVFRNTAIMKSPFDSNKLIPTEILTIWNPTEKKTKYFCFPLRWSLHDWEIFVGCFFDVEIEFQFIFFLSCAYKVIQGNETNFFNLFIFISLLQFIHKSNHLTVMVAIHRCIQFIHIMDLNMVHTTIKRSNQDNVQTRR